MDLHVDEEKVQQAMDKNVAETIKNAVGGYAVRSAVEKAVADSLLGEVLAVAVQNAVSTIDLHQLTQALAEQLARSATKGVACLIQNAMIEMILSVKKVPEYDKEVRARERAKLEAMF